MKKTALIKFIFSMVIFGTIGLFVKVIDAERGFIACVRGLVGALFLVLLLMILKKKPSFEAIRKNLLLLLISGAAIGVNWILLFESYSYTSLATATLCYYMAPVFVIIASPIFLGTRVSPYKWALVGVALVGMFLVSGLADGVDLGSNVIIGILLALGAAALYASITILNKKMRDIDSYDMTIVQLAAAGVSILPYTIFCESNDILALTPIAIGAILLVSILHTGVAYSLFFSSVKELPAETVAIFSYLDPIVAVIISLFLNEPMTPLMGLGAALIILALVASEIDIKKLLKKEK